MGIDRPDDADEPPDRPARRSGGAGEAGRDRAARIETRSRQEYDEDLRAAIGREPRSAAEPAGAAGPAAEGRSWEEVTGWSGRVWAEYQRKWPPEANGGRPRDRPVSDDLGRAYDQIADREERRISPALREIERRDPDRHLAGFEHRLKDRDRLQEKVDEVIEQYGRSPKEAISDLPDAIRYTFQYEEAHYSPGLRADIARLREHGFEMVERRNFWSDEQYKGINSRWKDPDSGQRFEVQFHTLVSFEAKQITHPAYERLRSQPKPDELETMVLRAFQREVSAAVPVPPGAEDIPDYPERGRSAR